MPKVSCPLQYLIEKDADIMLKLLKFHLAYSIQMLNTAVNTQITTLPENVLDLDSQP